MITQGSDLCAILDAAYVSCPRNCPSRNDFDPLVNFRVTAFRKIEPGTCLHTILAGRESIPVRPCSGVPRTQGDRRDKVMAPCRQPSQHSTAVSRQLI